jgi:transcriptional regulator with GAF, ATPase, and Fis domain/predicted ATPase
MRWTCEKSEIGRGEFHILYKSSTPDGKPVILKETKPGNDLNISTSRLRREYEVCRQLQTKGLVQPLNLLEDSLGSTLVLDDAGDLPLDEIVSQGALEIKMALKIAANLSDSLTALHQAGFLHQDIQPSNILVHFETAETRLHGLGVATQVQRTVQRVQYTRMLAVSPAYMSPELSGRTNQMVDYRTDFYSLGVTLFQVLTGRLPFMSQDPLELVHAHVAKRPPLVNEINPAIPTTLAKIIHKLMEKSAEDRYQGGAGLKRDIERCLSEFEATGTIQQFDLAEHDPPSRFELHQRFYGRGLELKLLLKCFTEAVRGKQQVVMIAGYPGVGKTSLVNELRKNVFTQQGWFIAGKYDSLERETPYSGIREALLDLWRRVTSDEEELEVRFREKLISSLGQNLGVIVEVVPEMREMFSEIPPVLELDAIESKNRFLLCFILTLQALASEGHPLVLFLDDLQWADQSSLDLIEGVIKKGLDNFLFIGAYRSSEVNQQHALTQSMVRINKKRIPIETLQLTPLELQDIRQMVSETLRISVPNATPLADLVFQKTGGNAFHAKAFLTNIYEAGFLFLNEDASWAWDLPKIADQETTENVIDLTLRKISKTSEGIRRTLSMAAALGRQIDIGVLATVCGSTQKKVEADLVEACNIRILLKSENGYQFAHDHLQECLYSLNPVPVRAATHLRIGRLIAAREGKNLAETKIFTVLDHINQALVLIKDPDERKKTACLNLTAARTAKSAAAFPAAHHYITNGLTLLPNDVWSSDYELALAFHTEAAEAAFLTANYDDADKFVHLVIANAHNLLDKIPVYETLIALNHAKLQETEAIRISLEVVKLLGIEIPADPSQDEAKAAIIATQREVHAILSRPLQTTETSPSDESVAAMRILARTAIIAGTVNHHLYLIIGHKLFNLALSHPNSPETFLAHIMAGGMLCYLLDDYASGFKIADRGSELMRQSTATRLQSYCNFLLTVDINCWRLPLDSLVTDFIKSYRIGLESGDLMTASISTYYCCEAALHSGMELTQLDNMLQEYYEKNQRIGMERIAFGLLRLKQVCNSIKNGVEASHNSKVETHSLPETQRDRHVSADQTVKEISACHEMMALFIYRQASAALEASLRANRLPLGGATALLPSDFYICLSLTDALPGVTGQEKEHLLGIIALRRERLQLKAQTCPINHQHKFDLVEAQRCRQSGDLFAAMEYFDAAIAGAQKNQYLQEEALANELAAEFYFSIGREQIATMYLHAAISAYGRWGSWGKLDQLYDRYRNYLSQTRALSTMIALSSRPNQEGNSNPISIDISSIERTASALSQELDMQRLLEKFMEILLQNAGAQRGFLLRNEEGQFLLDAAGSVDDDGVSLIHKEQMSAKHDLSHSILRHVSRSLEALVIGDATKDERFANTAYVLRKRPKSILCAPVLHRGRPIAFIYLENNRSRDVFSGERLAAIQVISAQAAIALENARLLEGLKQEVLIRRQTEKNLHRALDEVALLKDKLQAENSYLREEVSSIKGFDEIVGKSTELKKVLGQVAQVAITDATVLILGETGTGKELIARAIHNRSLRKEHALVRINCATLPTNLIESELFGHEKGAFTGALNKKIGRFELADKGTIFLDEIGELPLELQAKLLRVLQEGEFERVGSSVTQKINARVIAATNRDLKHEAEEGQFRSDLYFRLSVFPIELPPLRARKADIPLLVWYFALKAREKIKKTVKTIPNNVMDSFVSYHWPGNIRELENVIERAVILMPEQTLLLDESFCPQFPASVQTTSDKNLDAVERQHIQQVLEQCGWKVKGQGNAAEQLGLNPSTLTFRMKKLGIRRPRKTK